MPKKDWFAMIFQSGITQGYNFWRKGYCQFHNRTDN